jgi:N-carbamoyl-L-amino-acid hydrolase
VQTNVSIDADRLWSTLMESAEIGKTQRGGLDRLTLTRADKEVRDLFARWGHEGGYAVSVDQLGNMFVRRAGSNPALPPVLVGSHLDSQTRGGRFDGVLGVLAGLEVLRTLDDRGIPTERSIEVVNWTNEEGARFQPPMLSSLVFSGAHDAAWAYERRDKSGMRLLDALDAIGYRGDAPVGRPVNCYFELHIEQGPKLDEAEVPVGIVTGGYQSMGMRIAVEGEAAHVGPTPMHSRKNALVGAAHIAVLVDEIGWRYAHEDGKTTAARIDVAPNQPGMISDHAQLYIDFRHPHGDRLRDMEREVEAAVAEATRRSRTEVSIAERWLYGGVEFDRELVGLLRATAERLNVPYMEIRSQAGHDAYNMTNVCPTAMIFSPCKDGISHNEKESIDLDRTVPAVNLLLHGILQRAGG